jgi:hypothetical protein
MKGLQDWILIDEIVLQARIAQRASERLKVAYGNSDKIEVWGSIQSILGSAANVSKILWPVRQQYKERGVRLRQILKVQDTHILSDRKFRNYFEHYDEQVDEWFKNQDQGVYIDLSMNPSFNTIWGDFPPQGNRGYNSFNNTVVFRGETMDLNGVLKALEELIEKCKPYASIMVNY